MIKDIVDILKGISRLNVVPYYSWSDRAKEILEQVLGDVPYFLTQCGNVFIGEKDIDDIEKRKTCLQAHIDHPGGKLIRDINGEFLQCNFYGHKGTQNILGRKFGVFTVGEEEAFEEIEVEHITENRDNSIALYFKQSEELLRAMEREDIMLHYNASVKKNDEYISNWNLDDLINVAVIIYLMKNEKKDSFYGLLTINEEVDRSGISEALNMLEEKKLKYICMDTISGDIENVDNYGIRRIQSGIRLLNEKYEEVIKEKKWGKIFDIPVGICEMLNITNSRNEGLALFLKIENFHNGLTVSRFEDERIKIELLKEYVVFLKDVISFVNEENKYPREQEELQYTSIEVELDDRAKEIRDRILKCENYIEFLNNEYGEISSILKNVSVEIPNLNEEQFYIYREYLKNSKMIEVDKDRVSRIAENVISYLKGITNLRIRTEDVKIPIKCILLGNFNSAINYKENTIMLSYDRLTQEELYIKITHELVHYFTNDIWRCININLNKRNTYNEGLAVYITSKLNNISISESLNFSDEDFQRYMKNKEELEKNLLKYENNTSCKLFKGKYHQYFVKDKVLEPFYINTEYYPKYGYFVGVDKIKELVEEGGKIEKLSC